MNHSLLVTLAWLSLPLPMLIGIPFIRRAMLNEMWCDECGARFDASTDMPCHTTDGSIWQYRWTSEEAMLKAYFPDGHFVTKTKHPSVCKGYCSHFGCQQLDN